MEDDVEHHDMEHLRETLDSLQQLSYRELQQKAKAMCLPSNVKKVYLIQMIVAKQYQSELEVDRIVQLVRLEREQQRASGKKKKGSKKPRVQGTEISSTNNCSGVIDLTQKRPEQMDSMEIEWLTPPRSSELSIRPRKILPKSRVDPVGPSNQRRSVKNMSISNRDWTLAAYGPNAKDSSSDQKPLQKCQSQSMQVPGQSHSSDRVLRSYNLKSYQKPNYSLMNDSLLGVIKEESPTKSRQISIVTHEGKYPKLNVTARCAMKKTQSNVESRSYLKRDNQLVAATRDMTPSQPPAKRQRTISGIEPIEDTKPNSIEYFQRISIRGIDGQYSKINAVVHKLHNAQRCKTTQTYPPQKAQICKTTPTDAVYKAQSRKTTLPTYTLQNTQICKMRPTGSVFNAQSCKTTSTYSQNNAQSCKTTFTGSAQMDYQKSFSKFNLNMGRTYKIDSSKSESRVLKSKTVTNNSGVSMKYVASGGFLEISNINNVSDHQITGRKDARPHRNFQVTVQDLINSNIDAAKQTFTKSNISEYILSQSSTSRDIKNNYPNLTAHMEESLPQSLQESADLSRVSTSINLEENDEDTDQTESAHSFSDYCHKKIRADQVKSNRMSINIQSEDCQKENNQTEINQREDSQGALTQDKYCDEEVDQTEACHGEDDHVEDHVEEDQRDVMDMEVDDKDEMDSRSQPRMELPIITNVFPKLTARAELMQPLYVQVSEEHERLQCYPICSTSMLESLLNFKRSFATHAPFERLLRTTSATTCVYSAPVVCSVLHPNPLTNNDYHAAGYPQTRSTYVAQDKNRSTYVVTDQGHTYIADKTHPSYTGADQNHSTYDVGDQICTAEVIADPSRPTYVMADHNRPTYAVTDYNRPTYVVADHNRPTYFVADHNRPTYVEADHNRPTYYVAEQTRPTYVVKTPTRPTYGVEDITQPQYGAHIQDYDFIGLPDENALKSYENASVMVSKPECASVTEFDQSCEMADTTTIPEMVEDALEIISQDGDYMDRIAMGVRMQCILCSWAGSKIILEHHIRKEHSDEILASCQNEWIVTWRLGSMVEQPLWLSRLMEYEGALYALSVKYEDPERLMAAVSMITPEPDPKSGSITIFNKVTGEPYTWRGEIPQLHPNMPYENINPGLHLELSQLNLLPNRENLKLLNRELVIQSPRKVVVGAPELNDIQISMFVKIFY